MNTPANSLSQQPGPYRGPVTLRELAFGVAAGPIAWAVEFNVGYGLASWPCFPGDHRMQQPLYGYGWSWPALIAIMFAATLIALVAMWVSWRSYRKTAAEPHSARSQLEPGNGRARFLALWGVVFSGGFALASLATGIAYLTLPRCGG